MIQSQGVQNNFQKRMEKLKGFLVSQRNITPIEEDEPIRKTHTPLIGQSSQQVSFSDDEEDCNEEIKQIGVKSKCFDDEFEMGKKLGEGTNGIVRLCWKKDNPLIQFAVKIIQTPDEELLEIVRQTFLNSTLINNPYIAKCYKLFIDLNVIYMVMEYVPHDNLQNLLSKKQKLHEQEVQKIACYLLKGIRSLHSGGICHRDIKPDNILINPMYLFFPFSDHTIKLIDFGVSRRFVTFNNITFRYNRNQMLTVTGNLYYRAPEIMGGQSYGYSQQVDIWAIGVVIYQSLTGVLPFQSDNTADIFALLSSSKSITEAFLKPEFLSLSSSCRDLIKRLMMWNPLQRLTASEALKHIWIPNLQTPRKINTKKTTKDDMDTSRISQNSDLLNKSLINSATILQRELQNTLHKSKQVDSVVETPDMLKSQKSLGFSIKIKREKEIQDFKTKLKQFKLETSTKIYKRSTTQLNTIQLVGALDDNMNTSFKMGNEDDDIFGIKVCGSQHSLTQIDVDVSQQQQQVGDSKNKLDASLLQQISELNL